MSRPTYTRIDLAALHHNLARVRQLAPKRCILAMIKANAYGHGIIQIAQALQDADALGVASLEEGIILREAGIRLPIVLMEGVFDESEIALAARYQFSLVVHHLPHVDMLQQANVAQPFTVWLKLNTGMHRLGFAPGQLPAVHARLQAMAAVKPPVGLMTHFASADLLDSEETNRQIQLFDQLTGPYPGPRSMANSAAILASPASHADWVRPGLMLYGASPFADKTGPELGLQPVMTLWSRLIALTQVRRGGRVGYDGTWTAPEDMTIGVVGIGYGDGYPQSASNGTPVLVNGQECPLVGRVSMDMLTVDLRGQPGARIGDPVILWGESLAVERVARHCHSTAYELLTRVTLRPRREICSTHSFDAPVS